MRRITIDLDRSAVITGDHQALADTGDIHGRGVLYRNARITIRRPMGIRGQFLDGITAATGKPRQGERGTHQLQKTTPIAGEKLRRSRREFTLDHVREFRRSGKFFKTLPILSAGG